MKLKLKAKMKKKSKIKIKLKISQKYNKFKNNMILNKNLSLFLNWINLLKIAINWSCGKIQKALK